MSDWHELYVNWNLHWPIQELDEKTVEKMKLTTKLWKDISLLQLTVSSFIFSIFNPFNFK